MLERFKGDAGRTNLIDALLQQKVVGGERPLAERLALAGHLQEFQPGDTIIAQNASDDDVCFLLSGQTTVFVNHQPIAERGSGELVGEMAAIDAAARRSATVKAKTEVTALKVSATDFKAAGESSSQFWRFLAQLAAERLRERARFHLPANETAIMFVGSSVEGLKVTEEMQAGLKHKPIIVRPWTANGVFGASTISLESITRQLDEADFAAFVFGPDDKIASRDDEHNAPRDNVVFEMGLFIGRLGRDRVFMVLDADVDLKIPSDLLGITPITYKCKKGCTLADVIGTVCTDLLKAIETKGVVTNRMKV